MKKYFITGIDTNIGKTIVSSVMVEALNADYWKPIQSGDYDNSDSEKVKSLLSNHISFIHPERWKFKLPASPHLSAKKEDRKIQLTDFTIPNTQNQHLIIEGAGGLMVPINDEGHYISDLIHEFEAEVILVSKNYLGSINHTLLSIDYLTNKNIPIRGIIFNGEPNESSEKIIEHNSGVPILYHLPFQENLNKEFISFHAKKLIQNFPI